MTNHWADIANATCIIAWGANPTENHPACVAHINRARFPSQYFPGTARGTNKKPARMIVIDPRKTRTALMMDEANGDRYVRIRPGTDIALQNGLIRYIISKMETGGSTYADGTVIPARVKTAFFNYLNETSAYAQYRKDLNGGSLRDIAGAGGHSKYTDARMVVNAAGTDYERTTLDSGTADQLSNIPLRKSDCRASYNGGDVNTVYERMKAHVAPYSEDRVIEICGCLAEDIAYVGDELIKNSRFASQASTGTGLLTDIVHAPENADYRAGTILYAMGITQHTVGAQNVKGFANLQVLLGNMGRAGGGINALRGIHNVQGSTDMGLLYGNIPAYSGNPTVAPAVDPNGFGKYMNALWGYPLLGTAGKTVIDGSYDDAYNIAQGFWQQAGFYSMTQKWFGDTTVTSRANVDKIYSLWPKGNGDNHIVMFRNMGLADGDSKRIRAAVVWGQNPAVTEPNQSAIRVGLKQLDTLILTDMFETETVGCDRRSDGVTFLFPTAAHVEKAGSVTNSGRTLQWRYKAKDPAGNSKDDNELLLRFAYALDQAGAFQHIEDVWDTISGFSYTSVYDKLYGGQYGGFDGFSKTGLTSFAGVSGTAEVVPLRKYANEVVTATSPTVYGSEWIAEKVYREMTATNESVVHADGVGTIWIYQLAYKSDDLTSRKHANQANWMTYNRAKARDNKDYNGTLAYPGWGYSWLVNRRVLYNNSEVPGDVADFFMGPDSCARFFVSDNSKVLNYTRWYRTIHRLADKPSGVVAEEMSSLHWVTNPNAAGKISYAGRFPAHCEPYESPFPALAAATSWGTNTKGTAVNDLIPSDTPVGTVANYPLVLTTIRCVEHFQGGPITRNNWWNVEAEPEPWVEINSADAFYSDGSPITNGDMVNLVTARSNSTTDQESRTVGATGFAKGFRARVGVGSQNNQRVAPGVVAIPWHWGDRALSAGSRANDLCIDAMDANTTIPEYKACLCKLVKIPTP